MNGCNSAGELIFAGTYCAMYINTRDIWGHLTECRATMYFMCSVKNKVCQDLPMFCVFLSYCFKLMLNILLNEFIPTRNKYIVQCINIVCNLLKKGYVIRSIRLL